MIIATILVYNNFGSLLHVLECLRNQVFLPDRVIIIDNGSTPPISEEFHKYSLQLNENESITRLSKNQGVGVGHNKGIEEAKRLGAQYVWVLEHDTFVNPSCLATLNSEMSCYDDMTVLVPTLARNNYEAALLSSRRGLPGIRMRTTGKGHALTFNGILLSTLLLDKVGPIREDLFVGQEDRDYAFRINKVGGRVVGIESVLGVHPNRGTNRFPEPQSPVRVEFSVRNSIVVCKEQQLTSQNGIIIRALLGSAKDVIKGDIKLAIARIRGVVRGLLYRRYE